MCHLFSISGHAQFSVMNSSFLQALDTDTYGFDPVFTANELMHNTRYWASGVQQDVDLSLNFHALRPDEGNVDGHGSLQKKKYSGGGLQCDQGCAISNIKSSRIIDIWWTCEMRRQRVSSQYYHYFFLYFFTLILLLFCAVTCILIWIVLSFLAL